MLARRWAAQVINLHVPIFGLFHPFIRLGVEGLTVLLSGDDGTWLPATVRMAVSNNRHGTKEDGTRV